MNKYLLILLILCSCGGKGGEGRIRVVVWDKDWHEVWSGKLSITYNTKDLKPKKYSDEIDIVDGMAVFNNMKIGNYCVTFQGNTKVDKCATQFKVSFEADRDIYLYEGKYTHQPDN